MFFFCDRLKRLIFSELFTKIVKTGEKAFQLQNGLIEIFQTDIKAPHIFLKNKVKELV